MSYRAALAYRRSGRNAVTARATFWVVATALIVLSGLTTSANAESVSVLILDQNGNPVRNAVVVAVPASGIHTQIKPKEEILDQIDKEFVPYVKPILVGSTVRFPNQDNIRHHVYSFSPAKNFELPLYSGAAAPPVLFDKVGVVVLGCNIHDWMVGYIYVSESPFYAKTEADGRATINGLPREEVRVRVWHPDMTASEDSTARSLAARENNSKPTEWRIELKPTIRVRRTAPGGGGAYR
jgi:hypothetical protein